MELASRVVEATVVVGWLVMATALVKTSVVESAVVVVVASLSQLQP